MLKLKQIGRHKIDENIKEFCFDGCHKLYLISNKEEKQDMIDNKGWEKTDFLKLKGTLLEELYYSSCSLRFIEYAQSRCFKSVVPQFTNKTTFVYEDTATKQIVKHIVDIQKDRIDIVRG